MERKSPDLLSVTIGDPAGIGPEVIIRSLPVISTSPSPIPLLIGRYDLLCTYRDRLSPDTALIPVHSDEGLSAYLESPIEHSIPVYDMSKGRTVPVPGKGTAETGAQSLEYIDKAVELFQKGLSAGIVTGPVSKSLIEKSGTHFTGHTEYIAGKTGGEPYMMMYSPEYTVILVTTHLPVTEISLAVSREQIMKTVYALNDGLMKIKEKKPVLAVAGLDPHCGDDGAIGTFDRDVTVPLIYELQNSGFNISGPYAADTLFIADTWKQYDGVVAMYHDQGLIPFKMCAFDRGVNVTLGLPVVRTSVDHGTAFDIAGKDRASHSSFVQAYNLAASLTRN